MHLKLIILAALLGTLEAQTCTSAANNPTPSANPVAVRVCYTQTGAAGTAGIYTVTSQPAGMFSTTTTLSPAGSTTMPGLPASCAITNPISCTAAGVCTITLTSPVAATPCAIPVGTEISFSFTTGLANNPATGLQYFTTTPIAGTAFTTSYAVGAPSPSPIQDTSATICTSVASTVPTPQSLCALTQTQLAQFTTAIVGMSSGIQASVVCPSALASIWVFEYANPGWVQTVTSTGARSVTIYYWGNMLTAQMTALVITYPVTAANLAALNLDPATGAPLGSTGLVPAGSTPEFLVRIERATTTGLWANDNNPIHFIVAPGTNGRPITQVIVTTPCTGAASTVTGGFLGVSPGVISAVPGITGVLGATGVSGALGSWGVNPAGEVVVIAQRGGLFVGYSTSWPSPSPIDEGSDEALLGLLGLLGIPFLLCCCLALWCWHRARNAPYKCCTNPCPAPCPCPCPVQECVVQQCVPMQTVAVVPPCTPIFPMPYY